MQPTASQKELRGLAGRAPPTPAYGEEGSHLVRDPVTPARTAGCSAAANMLRSQAALGSCRQPQLPLRFTCVGSTSCWKHQLDWPQPEATYGSTHKPTLTVLAGAYGKSNAVNTRPCHYPVSQLYLAFRSLSRATLAPDLLCTICFWQQLRKY